MRNRCLGTNFVSNGSRGATADILTDGASVTNSEPNGGITPATYLPSPEAVEEFKVRADELQRGVRIFGRFGREHDHALGHEQVSRQRIRLLPRLQHWTPMTGLPFGRIAFRRASTSAHPTIAPQQLRLHDRRSHHQEQDVLLLRLRRRCAPRAPERVPGREFPPTPCGQAILARCVMRREERSIAVVYAVSPQARSGIRISVPTQFRCGWHPAQCVHSLNNDRAYISPATPVPRLRLRILRQRLSRKPDRSGGAEDDEPVSRAQPLADPFTRTGSASGPTRSYQSPVRYQDRSSIQPE